MKYKICFLKTNSKIRVSSEIKEITADNLEALAKTMKKLSKNYGVLAQENGLVILDFDNEITHKIFTENFKSFLNTYTVKTKKGYHYYYRTDFITNGRNIHKNGFDIDIKASQNSYVVGAGSIVDGFEYQIINNTEPMVLSENDLENIIVFYEMLIDTGLNASDIETGLTIDKSGGKKQVDKFLEGLIEQVIAVYTEGVRQNLVLALGGYLRKIGYSYDVVKEIIERIAKATNDKEIKQRVASLSYTYSKPLEKLIGYSYLVKFENIARYLVENKPNETGFIEKKKGAVGVYYQTFDDKGVLVEKPVVLKGYLDSFIKNEKLYLLEVWKTTNGDVLISDLSDARKYLFIKNQEKYVEYITESRKPIYQIGKVGWLDGKWVIYGDDGYYWKYSRRLEITEYDNNEKRIQAFVKLLEKKNIETKCMLLSFTNWVYGSGFGSNTVFFIQLNGLTGVGKTTLARMMATFWDKNGKIETANTTITGAELLAKNIGNGLLVLDEYTSVDEKTLTNLVYFLSTGQGKTRGRKDLSVDNFEIHTNIVITGEIDLLSILKNLGISRRLIRIEVEGLSYSYDMYTNHIPEIFGGWYQLVVKEMFEKYDRDTISQIINDFIKDFQKENPKPMDYAIKNIVIGLSILYRYLLDNGFDVKQILFDVIKEFIVAQQQGRDEKEPLNVAVDTIMEMINKKDGWVIKKLNTVDVEYPKDEWIGIKTLDGANEIHKVVIPTSRMKTILEKHKIHRGVIKKLLQNEIIKRTKTSLKGSVLDVYEINLEKLIDIFNQGGNI